MKTKILLIVCFIAFLATMQSCIDPYCPVSKCVNGNGSIVSEEFLLDNFNSVVSKTVVDIEIIQGEEQKVLVEGHENMIHELWLRVSNGRLDIDLPDGKGFVCLNCFQQGDSKAPFKANKEQLRDAPKSVHREERDFLGTGDNIFDYKEYVCNTCGYSFKKSPEFLVTVCPYCGKKDVRQKIEQSADSFLD